MSVVLSGRKRVWIGVVRANSVIEFADDVAVRRGYGGMDGSGRVGGSGRGSESARLPFGFRADAGCRFAVSVCRSFRFNGLFGGLILVPIVKLETTRNSLPQSSTDEFLGGGLEFGAPDFRDHL